MATAPVPAPAEASPRIGALGRIFGALFSPKETFSDIAQHPTWLAPVVLLTLISLSITLLFNQRVGWERFMEKQFAQSPRTAEMTAEQKQQAISRAVPIARGIGYVSGTVGQLIFSLILAGIFLGAFNLMAGAGLRFKTSLGVTTHSLMPGVVSGVLGVIILMVKDPDDIDLQNLVASNPGALLGTDFPAAVRVFAGALDIFVFWILFLLATGFSAANPKKVPFGKALGIVVGLWGAFLLVRVGWAAAFA